ncbi:MAG TPA: DUF3592 domain-containing protein [Pirellulales bacterium]|nr:DUF3592 domain-containing protein [Pirellulales bacterium]
MARYLIRFYGKKRGGRRTGSSLVAKLGSAGFCALALAIGCVALGRIVVGLAIPEVRANRDFVEQAARLIDKRLDQQPSRDGALFAPRFRLQFTAQGRTHTPWAMYDVTDLHTRDRERSEELLARFEVGREYSCWYDPRNPDRVVLARGYTWFTWLMLVVPVPFIAVGIGGLSYLIWSWGKSTERRAILSQESARREQIELTGQAPPFPAVPSPGDVTDSPGTTLSFRLPAAEPRWNLLGLFVLFIVWNSIVAIFAWMAIDGYQRGSPDWLLALLVAPFTLAGAGLAVLFIRQLIVAGGVGPTIVEISEHPLYPGGNFELFIDQSGKQSVKRFRVLLVCEEEATYRQGTDARTATRRVYEHEVYCHEVPEGQPGTRLQMRAELEIPASSMHSFRSPHNKVSWKLIVGGEVSRLGEFERSFLLHVYPCRLESRVA